MFEIKLIKHSSPPKAPAAELWKEYVADYLRSDEDDAIKIAGASCSRMAELGLWELKISGLGLGDWNVSVRSDLMAICLSLPVVATRLENHGEAQLHFWDENLDTMVRFVPLVGDEVLVTADSRIHGNLKPCKQSRSALVRSLRAAFRVYYEAVEKHCPEVNNLAFWKEFVAKPEVQLCLK